MNKKLTTVFLILTVLPVGLLIWIGLLGYRREEDRSRQLIEQVGRERITSVNLQIEGYFNDLQRELLSLPDFSDMGIDEIRRLGRRQTLVRQFFLIGEGGEMIYPPEGVPLSEAEREFLTRTSEIGLSRGLFLQADATNVAGQASDTPAFADFGWYTWYLGEGINFIFWRMDGGNVLGMELNRDAVIAGIINNLPATDDAESDRFRVELRDIFDEPLYIWGSYSPADGTVAVSEAPAAAPVAAWRLQYYIPGDPMPVSAARVVPIFASIVFVIIAIVGLALYLYRTGTREVRDAYKKVSFVNQVSHELKTPLTNIRMYAELLDGRIDDEDDRSKEYIGIVTAESRRLSRLIANVLSFAKDKKKGHELAPAPGVVDIIIAEVLENFRPSLESKGVKVETTLQADRSVMVDADVLSQITSNLIGNVEKYAADGKYLSIESAWQDGNSVVIVRDKGPGIPKGLREKVFTPFFRISNNATDGVAGTGIGLAIVRNLARLHNGSAVILPEEEGAAVRIILATPEAKGE